MTERKRRHFLILGVCIALILALCLKWHTHHRMPVTESDKTESSSISSPPADEPRYRITHSSPYVDTGVVKVDRSIQFTFPGDSTISPGSLARMTGLMHSGEIEIATKLARDIKFPAPP